MVNVTAVTQATSTVVTASPSPAVSGESVTLTAKVSHTTGSGAPTGTVTFSEGSTTLGTATLSSTGTAAFSTTALPVGSDTITAAYSGDTTYAASSNTVAETVDQVGSTPTSTAVIASPSPAVTGTSVTLTATVSHTTGSATPTGTVTFSDGTTTLGTATLSSTGTATFSTTVLPVGSDTITASYGGDTTYAVSSSTVDETVTQAGATATSRGRDRLAQSGGYRHIGDPDRHRLPCDRFGHANRNGDLQRRHNHARYGHSEFYRHGHLQHHGIARGQRHDLGGLQRRHDLCRQQRQCRRNRHPGRSDGHQHRALTASPSPAVSGTSVTLTATVSHATGSATPTGTVTFADGSTTLGTATLSSTGTAAFSTTALPVGSETITASYSGDATYAASSGSVAETVNQVGSTATSTTVTASPSPAVSGASVTLTATISHATGSAAPTGTVTFSEGSTTLGTATLSSTGTATFSTTTLPVGSDTITASYSGDTTYAASSGTVAETINAVTGSLAGYVYFDNTDSGQRSASDWAMGGVTIRLLMQGSDGTWTEVSGKSPIQTGADGSYSFTGLAVGNYQIQETPPPQFVRTGKIQREAWAERSPKLPDRTTSSKFNWDRAKMARHTTSA